VASELCLQVERKTWDVEKQKYKLENQQLMERLEATNRLVVKVTAAACASTHKCHDYHAVTCATVALLLLLRICSRIPVV